MIMMAYPTGYATYHNSVTSHLRKNNENNILQTRFQNN